MTFCFRMLFVGRVFLLCPFCVLALLECSFTCGCIVATSKRHRQRTDRRKIKNSEIVAESKCISPPTLPHTFTHLRTSQNSQSCQKRSQYEIEIAKYVSGKIVFTHTHKCPNNFLCALSFNLSC